MAAPKYAPLLGLSMACDGGHLHRLHHHVRLVGLFLAITSCFLVYSLIQERLMTLGFGSEKERFTHSLFIILVNRLVCCTVVAATLSLVGKSLRPAAPLALFSIPSLANVLGSASQYEALKYVSFPLQALAKCAKTVPVMAWGLVLGGRKYDAIDYFCAGTVTFGCALFVLTGSIAAPQQLHSSHAAAEVVASVAAVGGRDLGPFKVAVHSAIDDAVDRWMFYGLLLLAAFLLFDGLTSTTQDKLFAQYEMHSVSQLLWVSIWSAAISFVLLVVGSQLLPALLFVWRHPIALGYILLLSLVSTAVQLFIFYTIQQYGALHFALIMTIRQFLSIVLSCLVFSHDLSGSQWCGMLLVIGGLVARGMHRGGLDRTSANMPALRKSANVPALRRTASMAGPIALLLPLTAAAIPIIDQATGQAGAVAAEEGQAMQQLMASPVKKYGGILLDVQAGGLASSAPDGTVLALRRGSPMVGSTASLAPRRKVAEVG